MTKPYHLTQEQALEIAKRLSVVSDEGFIDSDYLEEIINAALDKVLGEPVAWRYKAVAIVNEKERVPVREIHPQRLEYEIAQGNPHDRSHLNYPLNYPLLTDYEPLYAPKEQS